MNASSFRHLSLKIGHSSFRRRRRGLSLLELLAVITVLSILAGVVIARNGRTLLGNYGAEGDARRIGLALLQAKRRAITAGNDHAVEFTSSGGTITSYSVVSIGGGGVTTLIDGPRSLATGLAGTASHTQLAFTFEGHAAAPYWVELAGSERTWRIDVVPITGAINTTELP